MSVRFHGRQVDPIALWANYIEWPSNFDGSGGDDYAPLTICPNPEHVTNKRHFQVNLKKDLVHCFAGCGISGTYEHAISTIEGTTQRAARKKILMHSRVGGEIAPRKKALATNVQLDNTYEKFLPPVAMEYLESRGISSATVSRWELGWDMDALRIVIPAKDTRGRVKFLIRRTVKPKVEPRYLYPKDSERNRLLFGACFFDQGVIESQGIVLVEGSVDTMLMHQWGITWTGGILGSKLSEFQAKRIMNFRPPRIYTMFDMDGAGIGATFSVKQKLPMIPIYVCRYRKGFSDPGELTREEAFRMIERAIPFGKFKQKVDEMNKSSRSERIRV